MKTTARALRASLVVGLGIAMAVGASGCSRFAATSTDPSTDSSSGASSGPVTITVGNMPPADQKSSVKAFNAQVAAFEEANPGVTVKGTTTSYDQQTFQALLAGGNLPNVIQVPFTEPQGLIARKQIADITDQVNELNLTNTLNADILPIAQDSAKQLYGIPVFSYAVGLNYNRKLFKQAGLDPDDPPKTWDEVRADAKIITEKTGVTGYAQMSNKNCGGWMFSAMTYAFGGALENAEGTAATFADTPAAVNALQLIHDMKWVDKSMGNENLYDCDTIIQAGASGKIAMYLREPAAYGTSVIQYGMDPDDFGATGMPTYNGEQRRTLTGGGVSVVSPKSTDAQKLAAVKWIDYTALRPYTDEATAVSRAKTAKADDLPVAIPGLPVVNKDAYATYFDWVKPYNNVPVENFTPYQEDQQDQQITPEPANQAQKVYANLDSLVQKVLTDENADIPDLVAKAQSSVTAQIAER